MTPGDTFEGGVLRRPVLNLQPGDRVDFECDPVADPSGWQDHEPDPRFMFEYATVEAVVQETPDCVMVYTSAANVGFPVDHMVEVDPEQTPEERAANLAEYLDGWKPGDYVGPRGREPYAPEDSHA